MVCKNNLPNEVWKIIVLIIFVSQNGYSSPTFYNDYRDIAENRILKQPSAKWLQLENLADTRLETGFYEAFLDDQSETFDRPGSSNGTSSCTYIRQVPYDIGSHSGNRFYQKYTEAYGIPVLGSDYVNDDSLIRACYVVRFLFADRHDLRNAFYKGHGRVVILATDEKLTALPEYAKLPKAYNSIRGIGGTTSIPVVAVGEERLECDVSDDSLVRELTIGILNIAIKRLPSQYDFEDRLIDQYKHAMANNQWSHTSASLSYQTYLGEGVQSYLNVNGFASPADGLHNEVAYRQELMVYDPGLFNLIVELLPCGNNYIHNCNDAEYLQKLAKNCPIQIWQ